jgi:hypothetical protein
VRLPREKIMRAEANNSAYARIKRRYEEYLKLYRALGDGSTEGATPFDEFYWRFIYYTQYADLSKFARSGY